MLRFYSAVLILMLSASSVLFPQLKLKGEAQAGIYDNQSETAGSANLYTELSGKISYRIKNNSVLFYSGFTLNPTFYNSNENFSTIKFSGEVSYYDQLESYTWGINLSGKKYNYSYNELFSTSFYQSDFQLILPELIKVPLIFNAGYSYQLIKSKLLRDMDLGYVSSSINYNFKNIKNLSTLYFEGFRIEEEFSDESGSNKGFRYGVKHSIIYSDKLLFQFYGEFLVHNSEFVDNFSFESRFRISAGKYLSDKISIYFLAEYFNRRYKFTEESRSMLQLIYQPMELQNKYLAKYVYDINKSFELFLRTGFISENIFLDDINFSSWIFSIGIELSK